MKDSIIVILMVLFGVSFISAECYLLFHWNHKYSVVDKRGLTHIVVSDEQFGEGDRITTTSYSDIMKYSAIGTDTVTIEHIIK